MEQEKKPVRVKPFRPKTDNNKPILIKKTTDVRLNKYISGCGVCSRRDADELIKKGEIAVNDTVITEMGYKIKPGDIVKYKGKPLSQEKMVYLLLNKPKDHVTTLDDPHAKRTVYDIVKNACTERIVPVGRLDRDTTGVLLFTNDGGLTEKLTHPSHEKKKIYQVWLNKPISDEHFKHIANGIELEDGPIKPDAISFVIADEKSQLGIEIHSGKNRIVRRIFEHFGYRVEKLDRVYFAGLTKKGLQRGKWRFLSQKEIIMLKMGAYS